MQEKLFGDGRVRDRMVVGFTTTYAISVWQHWSCEFESRSGEVYSIKHYVIKFVSDLRQVGGFFRALRIDGLDAINEITKPRII